MTDIFAKLICRPPRKSYSVEDLGPERFTLGSQMCFRKDITLTNRRNMKVVCSHYLPVAFDGSGRVEGKVPCVVYLHGNSGCRMDADDFVDSFLIHRISVFSLDFTGCGMSDGEHVTLGLRERHDLEAVLDHLRNDADISWIGLLGRSMGAAIAVYVASDEQFGPLLSGMILDSCYTSVEKVVHELAHKYVGQVPFLPFDSMVGSVVSMLRDAVLEKAGVDIKDIEILESGKRCNTPALIGHAEGDELVLPSHSRDMHQHYGGSVKELIIFEGDHNSSRPEAFRRRCVEFMKDCFSECEEQEATKRQREQGIRFIPGLLGFKSGPRRVGSKNPGHMPVHLSGEEEHMMGSRMYTNARQAPQDGWP